MSTFTGFKDYPDNSTPLSAEFLNAMLDLMYPIGKVEVFFDNLDHSDYLGFTWERTCVGKAPVGIDPTQTEFDTIGKTGGEKAHTLTETELTKHDHNGINWTGHPSMPLSLNTGSTFPNGYGLSWNAGASDKGLMISEEAGGNQPHNNLQPYQVFAFWKRVQAS